MTPNKHNVWAASMVVGVLVAVALPAAAQQTRDTTTSTRQMSGSGPTGKLEQYQGAFRASELVGATVYNDQGNSVGKVNDVLLDTSGKADKVVISVGGFLGIDSKYVDVSFNQLKIEPSHSRSSDSITAPMPANNSNTATTSTSGASNSSQYYSLVMPGATKDSLAKMPEFKFSS